ncbi:MAG: DUF3127 domain-containing protein [Bacteroidaceae bacterium]|nr:DUF3127 domain-containing protein [Bacteroidaceae bacterium]
MDITGKIIFASEPRGGVARATGNSWKAQDFVIETQEQYPKKCNFTVMGEDRLNQFNIKVGEELTVSIDIDAHEYNGRWFNDIRAWRVQRGAVAAGGATAASGAAMGTVPPAPIASPAPAPVEDDSQDDLPF